MLLQDVLRLWLHAKPKLEKIIGLGGKPVAESEKKQEGRIKTKGEEGR